MLRNGRRRRRWAIRNQFIIDSEALCSLNYSCSVDGPSRLSIPRTAAAALTNRPAKPKSSHRWIWQFRQWREIIIPPHNEQQQQKHQNVRRALQSERSIHYHQPGRSARSIRWYHYPSLYRKVESFHNQNLRTFDWQSGGGWSEEGSDLDDSDLKFPFSASPPARNGNGMSNAGPITGL